MSRWRIHSFVTALFLCAAWGANCQVANSPTSENKPQNQSGEAVKQNEKQSFYQKTTQEMQKLQTELSKLEEKAKGKAEKEQMRLKEVAHSIQEEVRAVNQKLETFRKEKLIPKWTALKSDINKTIEQIRTRLSGAQQQPQ